MIIFTQLCKVQKYLVKNFQNFDLARFKCMSRKISRDDLYQNTSQIDFLCFMKLQVVFSTANFVYKFKKSENFEKRRYNANSNANI